MLVLAGIYSLCLVGAALYPPSAWITVPGGLLLGGRLLWRRRRLHAQRLDAIQRRLSNLRSEGLFLDAANGETSDDIFYRMIQTLLTDLERTLFKLVEKNIQLLSLKEIGRSIISSLDEKKLVDSVFEYLVQGVGYKEAAFVVMRKNQCFQAVVTIERATRHIRRMVTFGREDLTGAIHNSLTTGKAFMIKDVRMHPMMSVQGRELFPGTTMTSYICVPLVKSSAMFGCRGTEGCLLETGGENREPGSDGFLGEDECFACPENPLLGALIVTDGYRAAPLTSIDHVTVETVGSLVSSIIENWMLYQELRQEELFREKVFEGMLHGLIVCDLDGNVTFANRSAREMCGCGAESILSCNIETLIVETPAAGDKRSQVLQRLLEPDAKLMRDAYFCRADGVYVPISMNVSKLVGDDNRIQGAIVLFVDMSEIRRMQEQIRHLDTLAVLGRFTSAIAHEVRNPLTGIAAGIQYLERSTQLTEEQRESISFILAEVGRINRIITDLFKVAKPRDLLYQSADLNAIIERSRKSLREVLDGKGIQVEVRLDESVHSVDVDPDQIMQVLINLIKNSAEALEKGGTIAITARRCGADDDMIKEKGRDMFFIDVSDNGPGIDQRDLERVFEPFFSRKRGGTGLGLFVTHSIVQHHQGRITVRSEPGAGTMVRVYLPLSRPVKGGAIETGSTSGG